MFLPFLTTAVQDPTGVEVIRRRFAPRASSVSKARRLATRQIEDPELATRVATVVSELTSNAVLHARSGFQLEVRTDSSAIRVTVYDGDPELPQPVDSSPREPSGRGLQIVAALSDRWGSHPHRDGKAVWAEIDI
ncbi:MAG: ATP-binding protein [Actinomycetes bacterium]|jgi:anti-sigma regulatory factor (Ser/Thr protein kinase)|nr:MAG: ATP-binding protein [Actinomycetota bacterium]